MKLKRLRLWNIRCHEAITVDFRGRAIGIFGPNGTGKSTLIGAVYAALTGDWSQLADTKLGARRLGSGETPAGLEFEFEHQGHEYRVLRSLVPDRTELEIDQQKPPIAGATAVQAKMSDILKTDKKTLELCVFQQQGQIDLILTATPTIRTAMLSSICRTAHCEKIHEAIGRAIGPIEAQAAGFQPADLDRVKSELELATVDHQAAVEQEQLYREACLSQEDRHAWQVLIVQASAAAAAVARVADAETALTSAREKLAVAIDSQTKAEQAKRKALVSKLGAEPTAELAKNRRIVVADQRVKLAEKQRLANLLANSAKAQTAVVRLAALQKESNDLQHEIADQRGRLSGTIKIGADGKLPDICPTCQTPKAVWGDRVQVALDLSAKIERAIADRTARKKVVDIEIAKIKPAADQAAKDATGLQARLDALGEISINEEQDKADQETIAAHDRACREVTATEQALAVATSAKKMHEGIVVSAEHNLKAVRAQDTTAPDPQTVTDAREAIEQDNDNRIGLSQASGVLQGAVEQLNRCQDEVHRLTELEAKTAIYRETVEILQRVRGHFHRSALPSDVINLLIGRLTKVLPRELRAWHSKFEVRIDESLGLWVRDGTGPEMKASQHSPGKRTILALSFWSALAYLWASELGILFIDEPTAHLDRENRRFLADAIEAFGRTGGPRQLIVVTHDDDLRGAFDQVIDLRA